MTLVELPDSIQRLGASLASDLSGIADATRNIRARLQEHADGKLLKGDEITGWLGEVYGKLLVNGRLVSDEYDYDIMAGNLRISVKARKGNAAGWNITSIIPKVEGEDCPTHLMFLQFASSYALFRVWLFPWDDLRRGQRFMEKKVRGEHRGYYVKINASRDSGYLIYHEDQSPK